MKKKTKKKKTEKKSKDIITFEEADSITEIELQKQSYEHIKLLMKKLQISEEEAGKLLNIDKKELFSLRFNAFTADMIEKGVREVLGKYVEKHGLKQEEDK